MTSIQNESIAAISNRGGLFPRPPMSELEMQSRRIQEHLGPVTESGLNDFDPSASPQIRLTGYFVRHFLNVNRYMPHSRDNGTSPFEGFPAPEHFEELHEASGGFVEALAQQYMTSFPEEICVTQAIMDARNMIVANNGGA